MPLFIEALAKYDSYKYMDVKMTIAPYCICKLKDITWVG